MCFKAPGQHCSRFGHSFTYLGSLLSCKEQAEWLSVGDWVPEEQEQPLCQCPCLTLFQHPPVPNQGPQSSSV